MKKTVLIALVSAAAIGAQAGVITLGNTWTEYHAGDTAPILSEMSADGFKMVSPGGASSANRAAYQTGLTGGVFGIGDTAILSFTVTANTLPTAENIALSFSFWDSVNKDGFSGKVDYGTPAGESFRVGFDKAMNQTRIGTDAQGRVTGTQANGDYSSTPLDGIGASSDITLRVTRNDTDDYSLTAQWDDVSLSSSIVGNAMNLLANIDSVGIRMNSKNATDITVSGVSMEVIPEPATLGLVAMVGTSILFVRRRFMI